MHALSIGCRDKEKIDKIVKSMKLKLSPRDTRHTDARVHLHALCSQWLPLSEAVLGEKLCGVFGM